MQFSSGQLYHVYNRGNNKQDIFFENDNYEFFLEKVFKELVPYADVLGYCLMRNHYHLLFCCKIADSDSSDLLSAQISRKIGTIQSSYTRAINKRFGRTGSLFQQKAKAKNVELYGPVCLNYIHQNPVKAGLCINLEDWNYSSYRAFLKPEKQSLINVDLAINRLGLIQSVEEFIKTSKEELNSLEVNSILSSK